MLAPNSGARKKRRRLGRGESSGVGKTSGKGGKGQTARKGAKIRPGFEGGQMPLYRRIPKMGFVSRGRVIGFNQFNVLNLDDLNRFDDGAKIDSKFLKENGFHSVAGKKAGFKLLGRGELKKKVHLRIEAASQSAKAKVEAAGGSLEIVSKRSRV